jgi:hypothetical protein
MESDGRAEIWLWPNQRVLLTGLVACLGIMILCGALAAYLLLQAVWVWGLLLAIVWLYATRWVTLLYLASRTPRLAYERDELLVYLEGFQPVRVPIDIVECFFLGQGPSLLPKVKGKEEETQNIIVRLAESAVDWKHRDVPDRYGHWCEGYITLRGAWCEPITRERMQALNRRLAEVHRERKARLAERQAGSEQHSA